MERCARTVVFAMLLCLSSCGGIRQETMGGFGGGGPGGQPLSTIHAQVFKLIVEGDIPQAIEYYKLAAGVEQVPRWLLLCQSAFATANRVAGPCRDVANKIYEAFNQLGQSPQLVRISSDNRENVFLAWQGRVMMSNTNYHVAVMNLGRVYDAFTGPGGMAWTEYARMVECAGRLRYDLLP